MASAAAARQASVARAAMEARQRYLWQKAANAAARLVAADRAYQEGELRVATKMYVSLALSRPKNASAVEAKQRLDKLAEEARCKLKEIDRGLTEQGGALSPGESLDSSGLPSPTQTATRWQNLVRAAFNFSLTPALQVEGGVF